AASTAALQPDGGAVTVDASPLPMKATMRLPAVGADGSEAETDGAVPAGPAVALCATNGIPDVPRTLDGALNGVLAVGGNVVAGVTGETFAVGSKVPPP